VDQPEPAAGRTERYRTVATSSTSTSPGACPAAFWPTTPPESMVRQNDEAAATVRAPVASASSTRSVLMRLPILHPHASAAGAADQRPVHLRRHPRPVQRVRRLGIRVVVATIRTAPTGQPTGWVTGQ
jgi:hypothetical protein